MHLGRAGASVKALTARVKKPHLGKRPMKFYITCHEIHLDLNRSYGEVFIVWRRGRKVVQSKPVRVDEYLSPVDGSLTVTASLRAQDLALLSTIYLDTGRNVYEPKLCEFSLHEVCVGASAARGGSRQLGAASLDLARYASSDPSRTVLDLELGCAGTLHLTLAARWLRNFASEGGDDDGASSQFSGLTGGSSEVGGLASGGGGELDYQAGLGMVDEGDHGDDRDPDRRRGNRVVIEDLWAQHRGDPRAGSAASAAELAAAQDEARAAREDARGAHAEASRLAAALARMGDRSKAALAERVATLEAQLERAARERAQAEEGLTLAYVEVVRGLEADLHSARTESGRLRAELDAARTRGVRAAGSSGALSGFGGVGSALSGSRGGLCGGAEEAPASRRQAGVSQSVSGMLSGAMGRATSKAQPASGRGVR